MIVVFGATGQVGREVVTALVGREAPVRAVSRSPEAARRVLPQGTDVVAADLYDAPSVRGALAGAEAVLVLSPHSPDQHVLQAGLVDAAREGGVQRVVKLSALDAAVRVDSPSAVGRLHWRTEQHLRGSGVPWTVVRPTPFMQNTLEWSRTAVRFGRLMLPMGHAPVAMVDAADVGAVLAAALVEDGHAGRQYVLTGPAALTFDQVAAVLGRAQGRRLRYASVPTRMAAAAQRRAGVDPWLVEHQSALASLLASGAASRVAGTVRDVTGRAPRTLEQFVATHTTGQGHGGGRLSA